jgi:hypothetical protein
MQPTDLDNCIIVDEYFHNSGLTLTQEQRDEVMTGSILTHGVAEKILGPGASEQQKKILFWERYLERYPEVSAEQLKSIEERMNDLARQSEEIEYTESMATRIPLSMEDFDDMKGFIRSLPENPRITGTTYEMLRNNLESPEAAQILHKLLQENLLLELENAELVYAEKYGMMPVVPPVGDDINKMIYAVANQFSMIETSSEEEEVEPVKNLWEDFEPEKTMTFDEVFDQYATNKVLQADPKRWAALSEEVRVCSMELVRRFELLYPGKALVTGHIEVDVKAKDISATQSSGDEGDVPSGSQHSSDECSHEGGVDKPTKKGKGFIKAAGDVMRKMTAPKKISDTLFKKIASKKIDEKLKKLEAEGSGAEATVENNVHHQIARNLMTPTSQTDLEGIAEEEDETECSPTEGNASDDSGDEDPAESSEVGTDDAENLNKPSAEEKGKGAVREGVEEATTDQKAKGVAAEEGAKKEALPGIQASEYDSFKRSPRGRFRRMNTTQIAVLVNKDFDAHSMKLDAHM